MDDSDRDHDADWPRQDRRGHGDRRRGGPRAAEGGQAAGGESARGERRAEGDRRDESGWQPLPLDPIGAAEPATGQLLAAAAAARERAQAAYSNFKVGAALETLDGTIVTGCNIENATYGLTLCAERVALVKALSDGHTAFTRLAIVADTVAPAPPCGSCRQLLWEYCGDIDVILGNLRSETGQHRLRALLPMPFDRRLLE